MSLFAAAAEVVANGIVEYTASKAGQDWLKVDFAQPLSSFRSRPSSGRKCQSRKYRGSLKPSLGGVWLLESALHKAPPKYAETPGAGRCLTQLPFGDSASTMRELQ